ncbi:unnamed protein product [Paramecium pentaurelia]|uniref:Uncharacterized protein n=1 Tax=Paramecium pentaurelia TaxID=43138 RepID=A0A8S1ULN3_9CILI|nr:unnamed protein product [Paramecium pentaurelia]
MQSTQGTKDQMKQIPLLVTIKNLQEYERFESFVLYKSEILEDHNEIRSKNIYIIFKKCLNKQIVQAQQLIIQIEDYKIQNDFLVVGKFKEISKIPYQESSIEFEEGAQDSKDLQLKIFSELMKDNYYNIRATLQDKAEKQTVDGNYFLSFTLNDSLSSQSIKGFLYINVAGSDAYSQFNSLLENHLEYIFEKVRVDTFHNQNQIHFDSQTTMKVVPSSIQWITLKQITFQMIGKNCNLIGYIYKIYPIKQISANLEIRKISIFDMDLNKVKIIIWGQFAKTIDFKENTILGFQNLVVKAYQNKLQLQLNYKTRVIKNTKSFDQIENFIEFQKKFSEQFDLIDKRSNFYKMEFSDLKRVHSEFKQTSDLNYIKYYRIKATIVNIQEINSIQAINKILYFFITIRDKSQMDFVLRVNDNKFIKKILNLTYEELNGLKENSQKYDKKILFNKAQNKQFDLIIIGQNVEVNNEIKSSFKLVKIFSNQEDDSKIEDIQKIVKIN